VVGAAEPSFRVGASDGDGGTWQPCARNCKGLDYQRKVTGAPENLEYRVDLPEDLRRKYGRAAGEVWIDGYHPGRNVWIEAKDWDNWPPLDGNFGNRVIKKELKTLKLQAELARRNGVGLEVHVPTEEKARELRNLFRRNRELRSVNVVVTPK